jgi:AcrR family transcriptional regulator
LAGAGRVFIAEGYEGASMSQIAAAAEVSKGTLYNYYPGKKELFSAVVAAGCAELAADMFGPHMQGETIQQTLTRIGRIMLGMMVSPKAKAMFRLVVMEAAKFPELAQLFITAGPDMILAHLANWLDGQTAVGRLEIPDTHFAAEQFFALAQTRLVMRSRADPSYQITEDEIAYVVAGAVQVFLAAYGRG